MFTGIIENLGIVKKISSEGTNLTFEIESDISKFLKIDQSIAHNGVCLTIIDCNEQTHCVTAIEETLLKTNLSKLETGTIVNLERCMTLDGRVDGHMVQGHVDQTATCIEIIENNGSWTYTFNYTPINGNITVEKGSICVNGVSLTVVNSLDNQFSVCIIPFTYEHTTFKNLKKGDCVNIEFDIIGKYVARYMMAMKG